MSRYHIGVLSGSMQRGVWVPPPTVTAVSVMGGAMLDFTEAVFVRPVVKVVGLSFWGGVRLVVPPNVAVKQSGVAVMGAFGDHGGLVSGASGGLVEGTRGMITVLLEGTAIMGGVTVVVDPSAAPARLVDEKEAEALFAAAAEAGPERRVADDGAAYTFDEFVTWYGRRQARAWWERSARAVPGPLGPATGPGPAVAQAFEPPVVQGGVVEAEGNSIQKAP